MLVGRDNSMPIQLLACEYATELWEAMQEKTCINPSSLVVT
jgi:hypothetical protein